MGIDQVLDFGSEEPSEAGNLACSVCEVPREGC